jgi:hypothetical protein
MTILPTSTIIPIAAPTIDTLIGSIALFSTGLLAIIGAIGGFLFWNGFVLRARAEKDLDRIEETARKSEKIFAEYKQRTDGVFKAADELMSTFINETSKVEEHGKKVKATAEQVQQEWERIKTTYSNLSQGSQVFLAPYPFQAVNTTPYAEPGTPVNLAGQGAPLSPNGQTIQFNAQGSPFIRTKK